ncbi:mitochondrial carrier domain-containing protein [Mycena sp. CBHHK59/15]|nr:mitochondrial carrier domain-containing protein [Mycena sp. CBHHK59/15]
MATPKNTPKSPIHRPPIHNSRLLCVFRCRGAVLHHKPWRNDPCKLQLPAAIDVVKTRIQIDPAYKGLGIVSGTRYVVAKEGPSALLTGFGPTAVGYLAQGGAKFAGDQDTAVKYRTAIYLGAASVAEFFADILLTPLEATRIRLVSERGYASGLVTGFTRLARERHSRTIPYAIGQFTVNEFCHELAFRSILQVCISLGSGVTAGFAAAILSHPADTLLSQINKGHGPGGSMVFQGLFATGPRMIMTAGLVSSQFLMYGEIKKALGAPPGLEKQGGLSTCIPNLHYRLLDSGLIQRQQTSKHV